MAPYSPDWPRGEKCPCLAAGKHPRVAVDTRQPRQHLRRRLVERHHPRPRLGIAQPQLAGFDVHILPAQPENLVSPAPGQHQQPDRLRTCSASVFIPRRMSVTPVASHTRTPTGIAIIVPTPPPAPAPALPPPPPRCIHLTRLRARLLRRVRHLRPRSLRWWAPPRCPFPIAHVRSFVSGHYEPWLRYGAQCGGGS